MIKYILKNIKVETIFLFFCLVFGFIFVFVTAPFAVADESSHFLKAWDVSQGHFIQKNPLITVPKSIGNSVGNVILSSPNIIDVMSLERNEYLSYFNKPLNIHETQKVDIANVAGYPFLPYLAPAFIFKICELLNLSPLLLMYFGRLINLIIYIIIVYYGIKLLPLGKNMFLLIVLMPMSLSEAASLSADSLNMALSFFTTCLFLKLALNKEKIQRNDVVLLSLSLLGIALSKQIYILLGLLFFMILKSNFDNKKDIITHFLPIILPSSITVVIWNFISGYSGIINSMVSFQSSNGFNTSNFLNMVIDTIIMKFNYIITSFVGYFGWLTKCYPLPIFLVYLYLIILVIVPLIETTKFQLSAKQKIINFLIFSLGSLVLFTISFSWEPVGSKIINGIQGRYFIPFIPLFFLVLQNKKINNYFDKEKIQFYLKVFIISFIGIMLSISSYILYYGRISFF
ncbi:MAG: DUF2142 domain-containing protein [Methanobrevibacter sp.]|jgi:uncharacterized membrane protein|nr:DUF2142 domain-containing protein [Candidatus Methanovirga meridionalis]